MSSHLSEGGGCILSACAMELFLEVSLNLYKIRDWESRYENAQSRRCQQLHWVAVPARHDAERYCELMARPDASEIFAAWIICLQVGARSEPRGSLVRSDGSPHTPASLSIKTRGHENWFEKALPYLAQIGWLECVTTEDLEAPSQLRVSSESTVEEGRKERREEDQQIPNLQPRLKDKFTRPSLEMVKAEARQIGKSETLAERFWNHYEAVDWFIGKVRLVSWTAKLRNWEENGHSSRKGRTTHI